MIAYLTLRQEPTGTLLARCGASVRHELKRLLSGIRLMVSLSRNAGGHMAFAYGFERDWYDYGSIRDKLAMIGRGRP